MSAREPAGPENEDKGVVSIRSQAGSFDGKGDDSEALKAALRTLGGNGYPGGTIDIDARRLVLTGDFALPQETRIDLRQCVVRATPDKMLFSAGWNTRGTANTIVRPQIFGGLVYIQGPNATGIAMQNAARATIRDVDFSLTAAGQTAIHILACDDPTAPYYGVIDGVRIRGNATPGAGQTGIRLDPLPVRGSIAVNRWVVSNLADCAAVDVGIDIRGSDGLALSNINLEACYVAGIRFGQDSRSYSGKVTLGLGTSSFICAGLIASGLDPSATIRFTSGANAGESCLVLSYERATGRIVLPFGLPHPCSAGDGFVFTEAKARNIKAVNVTYEGSDQGETAVHFTAGALSCKVNLAMHTMPSGVLFRREIEDLSNTIATRYDVFVAERTLTPGDGAEPLDIGFAAAGQGGFVVPETGWIDAVLVSGSRRGAGVAGEIEIEVFANGKSLDELKPKLTSHSPSFARKIRKSLANGQFLLPGQNIQVKANKKGLKVAEHVRVTVYVGYTI